MSGRSILAFLVGISVFAGGYLSAATGGDFEIDLEVLVPGGELSTGAEFEGMAVIGQPQIEALMVGGEFTVTEGFLNKDTASVPVELVSFTVE